MGKPAQAAAQRGGPAAISVADVDVVVPRSGQATIARPRLFDALDRSTSGLLTMVSAPPGSGKTALLASWLVERPRKPVAWLSLRQGGGEGVFWAAWLESLRREVPRGSKLASLRPPRVATPRSFVVELINGFTELDEPVTAVIDDFHNVSGRRVLAAIEELLRAAPAGLKLVISTRHDPPLPLHLLRASGDLSELRGRDLAFTPGEAAELLAALDFELEPALQARLVEKTDGWAAGLRLFTLSRRHSSDDTDVARTFEELDARPVAEYLSAETLAAQPDDVRSFLLATSIVDRLTPELADVLAPNGDGSDLLQHVVSENLFIERVEGDWYEYHQLFGALLRAELAHSRSAEVAGLHRRAAHWYIEHELSVDAIRHALVAGDVRLLKSCLVETWFQVFAGTDVVVHADVLAKLPKRELDRSAELAAIAATIELVAGRRRRAALLLGRADEAKAASGAAGRAIVTFARLLDRWTDGRTAQACELANELLELSASPSLEPEGAGTIRAVAVAHLGLAEVTRGRLTEGGEHLAEGLRRARESSVPYAELLSVAGLGWLAVVEGRLRQGARLARRAVELAETGGWENTFAATYAYAALALIEADWDDAESAGAHVARLSELARQSGDRIAQAWAAVLGAVLCLESGGDAAELALLQLRGAHTSISAVQSPFLRDFATRLEARLLTVTGEPGEAGELLDRSLNRRRKSLALVSGSARVRLALGDPAGALDRLAIDTGEPEGALRVERAVLKAVALSAAGDEERAHAAFDDALAIAEPENSRREFLAAGSPVRELLGEHLRRTRSNRWFAAELLRGLNGGGGGGSPAELLEPLSDRELEVLRYLPTMMSNSDIAGELFVSVNTVKTHVKSIYRKLNAARRQEAVGRARQLHLI